MSVKKTRHAKGLSSDLQNACDEVSKWQRTEVDEVDPELHAAIVDAAHNDRELWQRLVVWWRRTNPKRHPPGVWGKSSYNGMPTMIGRAAWATVMCRDEYWGPYLPAGGGIQHGRVAPVLGDWRDVLRAWREGRE
jgi:hypothetical protein